MRIASFLRAGPCALMALWVGFSSMLPGTSTAAIAEESDWLRVAFAERASGPIMKLGAGEYVKKRRGKRGVQVASLGGFTPTAAPTGSAGPSLGPNLSGGGRVRWVASSNCLNGTLQAVVASLSSLGSVTVSSTCRSHSRNRRVGGARKSHHLTGDAVDFRVRGNVAAVMAALRSNSSVGGIKHYGGGLFHVDTGPRRSW